ncbi:alpha-2-HS-glycoprotein-like isoform X5 [Phycodurus eques]|uniref:alpha-2-HS-glycoprotein-like isoform X5 n=1 Tax=Phycodurus eques TaxID=693459 RepID=UPI002ACD4A4C|nr:alpha-2-HS-glycoprotein-like isoform X5 [Phycodurus eques]
MAEGAQSLSPFTRHRIGLAFIETFQIPGRLPHRRERQAGGDQMSLHRPRTARPMPAVATERTEHTNEELMTICPSCPKLLALDDPTGASAVDAAATAFNRDGRRRNYFTLMEVARLTEEYVASVGTITWLAFALVETTCPREATSGFAACTPRCPDRANHVFCQTSYYNVHRQVGELSCETYPPKNSAALPAGEPEPVCRPLFHQSAEACVCQARLKKPDAAVHHICPFPLK